jgi:LysR family transcriptional activator of nhaA
MRNALETWFDAKDIRPRVIGEFEDSALMEVCATGGRGFTVVHTVVDRCALKHYGLRVIAKVEECGSDFYAITAERRLRHPGVMAITEHAYSQLFA